MKNSLSKRSNTGYRNISFVNSRNKFQAKLKFISNSGKENDFHIGYFDTLKEAVSAREEYIKSLF